jgi:hypothetical protein
VSEDLALAQSFHCVYDVEIAMAKARSKRHTVRIVNDPSPQPLSRNEFIERASTIRTPSRSDLARLLYLASLAVSTVICVCHVLSLTLVINFDGNWYVQLADMLGTKRFPGQWDFLRTPLFPGILKIAFGLLGRQALAVIGLQTVVACAGIWTLGRCLYRMGRPVEAAIGTVLLSAYPTLIAYEHALLTEVGTFFFLALLTYMLVHRDGLTLRSSACTALVIAAGYYYRSSLLYLSPVAGVISALKILGVCRWKGETITGPRVRRAVSASIIVAVVPFILAYPWQRYPNVSVREGQSVLLFGLVQQYVLPPDDPILRDGDASSRYKLAVAQSMSNGTFPIGGIQNGREYAVLDPIFHYGSAGRSIFLRVVLTHPRRYFAGVWRNLILYSGFGGFANDNAILRGKVFLPDGSKIDPGPGWFPPLGIEFERHTVSSLTSRMFFALSPVYDWLVLFGFIVTLITCAFAVWRLDTTMMAFTIVPLVFILLHAILLFSQDRMVLPTHPLLLTNLVLFPAWLKGNARTEGSSGSRRAVGAD